MLLDLARNNQTVSDEVLARDACCNVMIFQALPKRCGRHFRQVQTDVMHGSKLHRTLSFRSRCFLLSHVGTS